MNERITFVSDSEVRIRRHQSHSHSMLTLTVADAGMCAIEFDSERLKVFFDAEGQAALIEALQCFRDTGSFAALSDESAVPYTGKRMRRNYPSSSETPEVVILGTHEDYWHYVLPGDAAVERTLRTDAFLPLTPAPRVRPYTPVEAAAHLGREFHWQNNTTPRFLGHVSINHVENDRRSMTLNYLEFATECTWTDDGSPCGVVE